MKITEIQLVDTEGRDGQPKKWVRANFGDGWWYPKITEVGKIASGIGYAEDAKYPNGEGKEYLRRFVNLCWGKSRKEIDEIYNHFDPESEVGNEHPGRCHICGNVNRHTNATGEEYTSVYWFESRLWCDECYNAEMGWRSKDAG
jgi:hypothetical protein